MKSVICQLAWKLGTTMCFCHYIIIFKIIPIFKIILVFKIMIVIRFQIWFLIKFKFQRREWVWLKLCFSHTKGLWHYKYRSQCMHKGGRWYREKKKEKKNKGEKQGRRQKWENRGENKKKPRIKGGETEKKRRRRAFSSRCLHCYLHFRLRLH
jgi:hypothetical protein